MIRDQVEKRPKGKDERGFNATIVVVTTSCGSARSGKRLKRKSLFLFGKRLARPSSPIQMGHCDGTPVSIEDKEGADRETLQQT